jgi:hypothetical protein
VSLGEVDDVITARGYGHHLGVNSVDPLIGIHMQFGDKATSDKTDIYSRHRDALRFGSS